MAYIYDLTDTWSAGGTAFNAIKMNVTDSASAAGSKLITLQTNGTEHFSVSKAGVGYFSGNVGIGTASPAAKLEASVTSAGATAEVLRLSNQGAGANTQAQINFFTTSTSYATIAGGYGASAPQMTFNLPSVTAGNYVWQISGTERMRLDSSGNVGIGTTTPSNRFVVSNAGANGFEFNTTDNIVQTYNRATSLYTDFNLYSLNHRIFTGTSPTEKMRVDSNGFVGIGTTTPGYKLEVRTDGASDFNWVTSFNNTAAGGYGAGFVARAGSNFGYFYMRGDGTAYVENAGANPLAFATNGTEKMRIEGGGNVAIGTTAPNSKFVVTYSNPTSVPAAGAGGHCAAFGTVGYGLAAGAITNGNAYLQATRWDTLATNYDLMLQPNGGNVGIGTATPIQKLHVGGVGSKLAFDTTGVAAGNDIKTTNDYWLTMTCGRGVGSEINLTNDTGIRFNTNSTEYMRLDASGNLGIGTSSIAQKLQINGGLYVSGSATLGASGTPGIVSYEYPITRCYVGDASGYSWAFTARTASTNYDLMVIKDTGNVGIGTSSPNTKLEVNNGSSECMLQIRGGTSGSSSPQLQLYGNSSDHNWTMVGNHAAALTFNKGTFGAVGSELMRLDVNGNLLVGATSGTGARITATGASAAGIYVSNNTSGDSTKYHFVVYENGTERGSITSNGSNTAYNTSSDVRLKENIADADDAASLIDAIQVRKFDWKEGGQHQRYGFIAQELIEVAPEAVSAPADEDAMMGVDYSKLVPMLVKEIQSLRARVAQLEGN